MGDEDQVSQQQTRVLLVNGQTVILQGNPGDNAINEINADILQQALQEASAISETSVLEDTAVAYPTNDAPQNEQASNDNLLAIYAGDQGETHTIRLTVEQAEALGLHFAVEGEENDDLGANDVKPDLSENNISNTQLSFETSQQSVTEGLLLNNNVTAGKISATIQPSAVTNLQSCDNVLPEAATSNANGNNIISGTGSQPISLIPHYVDGTMSYTVKIEENGGNLCPPNANLDFQEHVSEDQAENIATQLNSTASLTTTTVPNLATSVMSSIPDIISSSTTQPIPIIEQKDGSLDPKKVSYIFLPAARNAGEMVTTTAKLSEIGPTLGYSDAQEPQRKVTNQVRIIPKTAIMSSLSIPNEGNRLTVSGSSQLTTVTTTTPISTSVVNASLGTSSLDPVVSSTPTGSGMIRVVAKKDFPNNAQGSVASVAKIIPTKLKPMGETNGGTKITPVDGAAGSASAQMKLPLPNFNSEKPLGSSDNPIQLVQQGQTFHSMQPLSREQLKQIATVLQQRHFDTTKNSKNVLYDAETNTRIIYRVVYPEDCDLRDPRSPSDSTLQQASPSSSLASVRGRSRRGRPPKSAIKPGPVKRVEQEEVLPDIDVNKGDKDERKKQLPRTRSGRLSRPPRHMVKDYKRLHHLDFAEPDLDDSDGGYSDYQISEAEMEDEVRSTNEDLERNEALLTGLTSSKRKISSHFRCPTCQKVYLGHRRMARHFEMYPDHGNIQDLPKPGRPSTDVSSSGANSKDLLNPLVDGVSENSGQSRVEGAVGVGNTEEPRTPPTDPSTGLPASLQVMRNVVGGPNGMVRHGGPPYRRRGRRRGPHAYMTPEARSERRIAKLREIIGTCEPREVVEVAGSIVAETLTTWEMLLLRAEGFYRSGTSTNAAHIGSVCQELRTVLKEASSVVGPMLVPISSPTESVSAAKLVDNEAKPKKPIRSHRLQINDDKIAAMLGVKCGMYLVSETDDQKLLYRVPCRTSTLEDSHSTESGKDVDASQIEKDKDMPPPSEPAAKKQKLEENICEQEGVEEGFVKSDLHNSVGDEWQKSHSGKNDIEEMLSGEMCESNEDGGVSGLTLPGATESNGEVVSTSSPCVPLPEVEDVPCVEDDVGEVTASGDHSSVQAVDELVSQHLEEMKIDKGLDYAIAPKPAPGTSLVVVPVGCGTSVSPSGIPSNFDHLQDHFPSSETQDSAAIDQSMVKDKSQNDGSIPNETFPPSLTLTEVVHQEVEDPSKLQQSMDSVISQDSVTKELHVDQTNSKVEMSFQLPPDRSMNLDLTGSSIDMSLDSNIESGPELDFEALSEEFNRNTQS